MSVVLLAHKKLLVNGQFLGGAFAVAGHRWGERGVVGAARVFGLDKALQSCVGWRGPYPLRSAHRNEKEIE